ncbi:MAG: MarR family winged helix-turn-helix transcriptional regulator [Alphaproteobacteria bacterium]
MTGDAPLKVDACNCLAVRKAARHVTQHYDRHLAPTGLKTSQFSILARLQRGGPAGIARIAADLVMDRTTLARNLGPLERDGLLTVGRDPADGRSRVLAITPAGVAVAAEARALWAVAQQRFDDAYGAERAVELRRTLAQVVATNLPNAS